MKHIILFFLLLSSFHLLAQKKSQVHIENANTFEYDESSGSKVKRLIGQVRFRQDNVVMTCDSAYFFDDENRLQAYSRVVIQQGDSFFLYSDFLNYEGNTKEAHAEGNVRMTDPSMDLTTTDMDFDLQNNIGYYTNGATIINKQNKLTSKTGYYYSKTNQVYFKRDVLLVNPEYTIDCDTLSYNSVSKTAFFLGPTVIKSQDNTIYCENGWYDTQKELSQFSRNARLFSKENMIYADSLTYNRKTGIGRGFRNIRVIDTTEKLTIRGEFGEVNRLKKITYMTKNPVAKKYTDNDSLYLYADTLFYNQTKDSTRILKAYYHASIYRKDMQAVSDSIVYSFKDSTITLFRNPIMWSEEKQLTADTIRLYMHKNKLDSMHMLSNAFIAMMENAKHFNQIKGRNMKAVFKNQKLHQVFVYGNGQSIYYAKDSSGYQGVNKIECSFMQIRLDSNKLQKITFYEKPEGVIYPVDKIPEQELRLKGFNWYGDRRPKLNLKTLF